MILQVKDILGVKNVLGRVQDYMTFATVNSDPICTIMCVGYITVESTKNGTYTKQTYRNLQTPTLLAIEADAGTEVKIQGLITYFGINAQTNPIDAIDVTKAIRLVGLEIYNSTIDHLDLTNNYRLTSLNVALCSMIEELDVQRCPLVELTCDSCSSLHAIYLESESHLQQLNCNDCTLLAGLDLSGCTELVNVELLNCESLTALDIAQSPDIDSALFAGCIAIDTIRTRAQSVDVVTAISDLIQENAGLHGVVYCNPDDTYYPDIETAAVNNGWTIEAL